MPSLLLPLMVVGDDTGFCYLMQRYAQKADHPVVLVHFTEDALGIALHETPAVVIVEQDVSGEKGMEILNAFKAHPKTCGIPVILCSWTDEADLSLDEDEGLFLHKPILYDDFHAALAKVGI